MSGTTCLDGLTILMVVFLGGESVSRTSDGACNSHHILLRDEAPLESFGGSCIVDSEVSKRRWSLTGKRTNFMMIPNRFSEIDGTAQAQVEV